jgi:hypothetical protein
MHAATFGVSKDDFERSLTGCLNKIQFGLASEAQQRIGYAWRGIISYLYIDQAENMTLQNLEQVTADCANTIVNLANNLKN